MNVIESVNEISNLAISYFFLVTSSLTSGKMIYMIGLINNYCIILLYLTNLIFVLQAIIKQQIDKRRI